MDQQLKSNLLSRVFPIERYDAESVSDRRRAMRGPLPDAMDFTSWTQRNPNWRRRAALFIAILSVVVIGFLAHKPALGCFFTGTDTFTLIDTARVTSARDLIEILCNPLMAGSGFVSQGLFYRPVSTLSYSLDYFFWGLNPFGYHLTNLFPVDSNDLSLLPKPASIDK